MDGVFLHSTPVEYLNDNKAIVVLIRAIHFSLAFAILLCEQSLKLKPINNIFLCVMRFFHCTFNHNRQFLSALRLNVHRDFISLSRYDENIN